MALAFARIVRRIEPLIDARLSVESRDTLARLLADFDNLDSQLREDIISICSERISFRSAANYFFGLGLAGGARLAFALWQSRRSASYPG